MISRDASSFPDNSGNSTSRSWSHTIGSGSDRAAFVYCWSYKAGGGSNIPTINAPTLDGVAMTLIRTNTHTDGGSGRRASLYVMTNPPIGSYTIAISASNATTIMGGARSYFNINQSTPYSADNGAVSGVGNSVSMSITVGSTSSWIFGGIFAIGSSGVGSNDWSGKNLSKDAINIIALLDTDGGAAGTGSRTVGGSGMAGGEIHHLIGVVLVEVSIVYAISGTVTLSGSPVESATIRCIRQSDNVAIASTTTDVSGTYIFEDLEETELYHLAVEYEAASVKYNALSLWDVAPYEVV